MDRRQDPPAEWASSRPLPGPAVVPWSPETSRAEWVHGRAKEAISMVISQSASPLFVSQSASHTGTQGLVQRTVEEETIPSCLCPVNRNFYVCACR